MSKFILKKGASGEMEAEYESRGTTKKITGPYLKSFLEMVQGIDGLGVVGDKSKDEIRITAGEDTIVVKNAKDFLKTFEDDDFVDFIKSFGVSFGAKSGSSSSSRTRRTPKKSKSIAYKGVKNFTIFLLLCGIGIGLIDAYGDQIADWLKRRNANSDDFNNDTPAPIVTVAPMPTDDNAIIIDEQGTPVPTASPVPTATPMPTITPTPIPTVEPTPVPTIAPTPVPTATPTPAITTRDGFNNALFEYARSRGIDPSLLDSLLYWNNTFDETRLNYYKDIIEFMVTLKNNSYNIEVYALNNKAAVIGTAGNGKFVVLPAISKNISSIVQVNPCQGSNSMATYPDILNYVRNGEIPDYMIIGSANCYTDFFNESNGDMLLKMTEFLSNHGYNISRVGVLGYHESGDAALLNAGHILASYPRMLVRVANIDGYNTGNLISEYNKVMYNEDSFYEQEVRGLINGNPEIVMINPKHAGAGIYADRPVAALNESMDLNETYGDVIMITSESENSSVYPQQALYNHILDYLAGNMGWDMLVDGNNYQIPNFEFNYDLGRYVYSVPMDNVNDSFQFGDETETTYYETPDDEVFYGDGFDNNMNEPEDEIHFGL